MNLAATPSPSLARRVLAPLPFWAIHVATAVMLWRLGWSWRGFGIAVAAYYARIFFVTAGYHRYFSHRSYRTSRLFQLVLAFFAQTSFQKGVLWWAAHHRVHHKLSDQAGDPHSMMREGFWRSHIGWILDPRNDGTDLRKISDLARFPELVWLNAWWWVPPAIWALASYLLGGPFGLLWATGVSTILVWHGTFTINSITHWMGKARYASGDFSKNSFWLALLTMGEGWHNNHHYYQRSTNQGFFWWEIDPTYYLLRLLQALGVVWDIHVAPERVKHSNWIEEPLTARVARGGHRP